VQLTNRRLSRYGCAGTAGEPISLISTQECICVSRTHTHSSRTTMCTNLLCHCQPLVLSRKTNERTFPLLHTAQHSQPTALASSRHPNFVDSRPQTCQLLPRDHASRKDHQGHARKLGTIFFGEIALFLSSFTLPLDQERKTG